MWAAKMRRRIPQARRRKWLGWAQNVNKKLVYPWTCVGEWCFQCHSCQQYTRFTHVHCHTVQTTNITSHAHHIHPFNFTLLMKYTYRLVQSYTPCLHATTATKAYVNLPIFDEEENCDENQIDIGTRFTENHYMRELHSPNFHPCLVAHNQEAFSAQTYIPRLNCVTMYADIFADCRRMPMLDMTFFV